MKTKNTKQAMIEFLTNHFRYDTMNSWNQSTSYAAKVKIYNFVPRELQDKAYQLLDSPVMYQINDILDAWSAEQDYRYQAGFNGRSGGYIVMIHGGKYENGQVYSQPGKAIDMSEDFADWSKEDLKARVELVESFDEMVEDCKATFIDACKRYKVKRKTITVEKEVEYLAEIE